MQAVITNPAGIAAGITSEEARMQIDVRVEELDEIVPRSRALSAAQRLAIYSRAYQVRLNEALRAEFPCVVHALGSEVFSGFVTEYLSHYPPGSYTLRDLGKDFPAFLEETRPDAGAPAGHRESWPDFIVELARFERAFFETYDGIGAEGTPLADHRIVDAMDFDKLSALRLAPVPCLRLLSFRYPVAAYFSASRGHNSTSWPPPLASFLAMNRRDYAVRFFDLSSVQYHMLSGLITGLPAREAATRAASQTADTREPSIIDLRTWIRDWLDLGFFLDPRAPTEEIANQAEPASEQNLL